MCLRNGRCNGHWEFSWGTAPLHKGKQRSRWGTRTRARAGARAGSSGLTVTILVDIICRRSQLPVRKTKAK